MTFTLEPLPWTEAVREGNGSERERFLRSHLDLVRYLALRIASRLPASVEVDDLVHDGIVGLIDAAHKFDAARGVRFRTYAEARVRGAILDGLRQKDWIPRSVRRGRRLMDETLVRISTDRGRAASEEEIADGMGLDLESYRGLLKDASAGPLLSLEDLTAEGETVIDDGEAEAHAQIESRELTEALADELLRLPESERRVMDLYYRAGLTMKEVGAVLSVTESRVCQLHAQAAPRLRVALQKRLRAPRAETAYACFDAVRKGRR
jgi:RNA polymerase sigma factor for flagellar operon FliA